MGTTHDLNPADGGIFTAQGGKTTCFPFRAPRRGTVNRWRLIQLDGGLDGFTFTLYSRRDAAFAQDTNAPPPHQTVLENYSGGPGGKTYTDPDFATDGGPNFHLAFQAAATRTVAATQAHDDPAGFGLNQSYANEDSQRGFGTVDRLYVVVTPGGSDAKRFVVDLCVDTPPNI